MPYYPSVRQFSYLILLLLVSGIILASTRQDTTSYPKNAIHTKGYGGTLTLALSKDADGTITSVNIVNHHETTAYLGQPQTFLRQFIGKGPKDNLYLGQDIDGISGATISSAAITDALRDNIKQQTTTPTHTKNLFRDILTPLLLLILALSAFFLRNNALRWISLSAGLLYFGLITKTMFSIVLIAHAGLLNIPDIHVQPAWWMLILIAVLPAFILGRIYCASLCPFALIQEALPRWLRHKNPAWISPGTDKKLRRLKYLLLFIILGTCFILGHTAPAPVETYLTLFTGHGTLLAKVILGLVLTATLFSSRFWCRTLCPAGAFLGTCATLAPFKISADGDCGRCNACVKTCPVCAIDKEPGSTTHPYVHENECILCGQCLRACPKKTLTLRRRS